MVDDPGRREPGVREELVALIDRMIDEVADGAHLELGREMVLPISAVSRLEKVSVVRIFSIKKQTQPTNSPRTSSLRC